MSIVIDIWLYIGAHCTNFMLHPYRCSISFTTAQKEEIWHYVNTSVKISLNTAAIRTKILLHRESTLDSVVLSTINSIVWTIFCWQTIKIWYKIICVSFTIHANILDIWNVKNRNVTVKTVLFFGVSINSRDISGFVKWRCMRCLSTVSSSSVDGGQHASSLEKRCTGVGS